MADQKPVSPETFLTFCLTQPMTHEGQVMVSTIWVAWFKQWLADQHAYGIEVTFDPEDPAEVTAKFRIQGMPNHDASITVPVEGTPYEVHVVSKVRTGCGMREPAPPHPEEP